MDPIKREEIRGLFTLSLLALLLVIRMNWEKMSIEPRVWIAVPFTEVKLPFDILFWIDVIAFCWIAYALSMIMWFSDDLLRSERLRGFFRRLGLAFLVLGPLGMMYVFSILVMWAYTHHYYPQSIYLGIVFIIILIVIIIITARYEIHVTPKHKEEDSERAQGKRENEHEDV